MCSGFETVFMGHLRFGKVENLIECEIQNDYVRNALKNSYVEFKVSALIFLKTFPFEKTYNRTFPGY